MILRFLIGAPDRMEKSVEEADFGREEKNKEFSF